MFAIKRISTLFVIIFLFLSLSSWVMAATSVAVIDALGQPVVNAVVSVKTQKVDLGSSQTAIMDQVNFSFVPRVLVIKKGQLVSFPNSDDIRHSVYSFSEAHSFELKLYKGNQTEPLQFNLAGIVVLGCNIHDDMIGYIYVTDDELAYVTDDKGMVTFPLDGIREVSVWHERLVQGVSEPSIYTIDSNKDRVDIVLDLIPSTDELNRDGHEDHDGHFGFGKKF